MLQLTKRGYGGAETLTVSYTGPFSSLSLLLLPDLSQLGHLPLLLLPFNLHQCTAHHNLLLHWEGRNISKGKHTENNFPICALYLLSARRRSVWHQHHHHLLLTIRRPLNKRDGDHGEDRNVGQEEEVVTYLEMTKTSLLRTHFGIESQTINNLCEKTVQSSTTSQLQLVYACIPPCKG